MGFDLYGVNPKNNHNLVKPEFDWTNKDMSEKDKADYFKKVDLYEQKVIGDYFRANVWWWRPIWSFVSQHCDDILTEEDIQKGSYNDAHLISKTKAKKIASRIRKLSKDGTIKKTQSWYERASKKAKTHNDKIDVELEELKRKVEKLTNNAKIAPSDYPKEYKDEWETLYNNRNHTSDYPFDSKFLLKFGKFCDDSGGFEIC